MGRIISLLRRILSLLNGLHSTHTSTIPSYSLLCVASAGGDVTLPQLVVMVASTHTSTHFFFSSFSCAAFYLCSMGCSQHIHQPFPLILSLYVAADGGDGSGDGADGVVPADGREGVDEDGNLPASNPVPAFMASAGVCVFVCVCVWCGMAVLRYAYTLLW
jgi:hypothetical protein